MGVDPETFSRQQEAKRAHERSVTDMMERVDKETPSPFTRFEKVNAMLFGKDLSAWDVICFCEEYLCSQAMVYEWLKSPARELNRLVYLAHYAAHHSDSSSLTDSIGGTITSDSH
jgi:hypothetical protein